MSEHTDNSKLIAKHVHQSEDRAVIQNNLNQRMEKVILRYLKKTNSTS